jgi:protein-disulfide isomerase
MLFGRFTLSGYTRVVYTGSLKFALLVLTCFFYAEVGSAQNTDAPKSKQPVATVGGQAIYEDELLSTVQGQLFPLRNQEYEIKRRALDNLIERKLLEAAAKKKGIETEKLLAQEVDFKVPEPGDAEIQAYYLAQKDRLNRPFDEVKPQLSQSLKQAKIQQARQDYLKSLRSGNEVVVLLSPPKMQVGYDPARVRGNPKAPVMIVEFSDFQCPYCHQVEPVVKELLAKYGDKVSLAYRDLPLKQIHPQAEIAAEASRCAGEQGKYWDYHDQLLSASKLDRDALLEYARNLKLDDKRFDSCLTAGKYRADIEKDSREGMQAGITGTPAFFINGVVLSGAEPKETFARIIDEELSQKR